MVEMIFVGYNYGRFKNDEGDMQNYCNVFVLREFSGTENADYHFSGQKAEKISCVNPDVFKDVPVGSKVLAAFNDKRKISYMVVAE